MSEWIKDRCGVCVAGYVSDYSSGDFEGAKECDSCNGSGSLFVSERDRLAAWPGGPFLGSWPGRFNYLRKPA